MIRGYFTRFLGLSLVIAVLTALPIAAYAADGLDTTSAGLPLHFSVGGNQMMTLTTTGLGIGIGSANPNNALEVGGTIKVGSVSGNPTSCLSDQTGALRYNTNSQTIEFCNGTVWGPIVSSSPCFMQVVCIASTWGYNCANPTISKGISGNMPIAINNNYVAYQELGGANFTAGDNPNGGSITYVPYSCPTGCPSGSVITAGPPDGQYYYKAGISLGDYLHDGNTYYCDPQ